MLAITKASLRAILRSPSAVVFSLGFPLIFILVFGFIGGGRDTVPVALKNPADSSVAFFRGLFAQGIARNVAEKDTAAMRADLSKGNITAILSIDSVKSPVGFTQYTIFTQTSSAAADKFPTLQAAIAKGILGVEERLIPQQFKFMSVKSLPDIPGREYKMIDFILPGMLGFSLLSAAVFGVAFVFFNLRQTLVLKRFFATPINRRNIVFGEALSRVIFQIMTAIIIILMGYFAFGFTLVNGVQTFLEMITLSLLGLIVFMGFGFIISSVAKNESSIPPFANIFTLPQFLLGGTFFSTAAFPGWLRKACEILPLKQLNDAMRNVAFEGAHLSDCGKQIGILAIWGVVIYATAIRTFKWE